MVSVVARSEELEPKFKPLVIVGVEGAGRLAVALDGSLLVEESRGITRFDPRTRRAARMLETPARPILIDASGGILVEAPLMSTRLDYLERILANESPRIARAHVSRELVASVIDSRDRVFTGYCSEDGTEYAVRQTDAKSRFDAEAGLDGGEDFSTGKGRLADLALGPRGESLFALILLGRDVLLREWTVARDSNPTRVGASPRESASRGAADSVRAVARFRSEHEGTGAGGLTVDVNGDIRFVLVQEPAITLERVGRMDGDLVSTVVALRQVPDSNVRQNLIDAAFGRGYDSGTLYVSAGGTVFSRQEGVLGQEAVRKRERACLTTFLDQLLLITPGGGQFPKAFRRGSLGGDPAERPVAEVSMGGAFEMDRFEVTQELWESVMGWNPSRWKGPRNSVELVDHREAMLFTRVLTERLRELGKLGPQGAVRLPTESEWEYCARAGTTTTYSFGEDVAQLGEYAWFHGNAAGNDPPVGAKKPNAWGLHDVHGYLWEWCLDDFAADYEHVAATSEAHRAPRVEPGAQNPVGSPCVLRGGSWKDPADRLTSSHRRGAPRGLRDDAVGLRCVVTGRER